MKPARSDPRGFFVARDAVCVQCPGIELLSPFIAPMVIAGRSFRPKSDGARRALRLGLLLPLGLVAHGFMDPAPLGTRFLDPDDAMRLVQVRDLVAGQGWFDTVPHRLDPPQTVPTHWSRLPDAPLAAIILLVAPLFGPALAEKAALMLWPPLLWAASACVAARIARRLGGHEAMPAAVLLGFAAGVVGQFLPGRIDHHGLQAVLGLAALAFALERERPRAAGLAGIFTGAAFAVGLDTVVVLGFVGLLFAGDLLLGRDRGGVAAYATGASVTLLAAFPLTFHPAQLAVTACDGPTPRIVFLVTAGLLVLRVCATLTRGRNPGGRCVVLAGAAMLGWGLVLGVAPSCLGGLAGATGSEALSPWVGHTQELSSLSVLMRSGPRGVGELMTILPPVLGLAGAVLIALLSPGRRRAATEFGLCLAVLTVIGWVAIRGLFLANAAAIGPIAAAAVLLLHRAKLASMPVAVGGMLAATAIVATSHVPLNATRSAASSATSAASTPSVRVETAAVDRVSAGGDGACDDAGDYGVLAALPKGLVLGPIWSGPTVLVWTPHDVISSPHHRFGRGNDFGEAIMNGTVENARRAIVGRGIDYVVLCRAHPHAGPFMDALRTAPPDWLERAGGPGDDLLVFRVRKEAH